MVFVPFFRISKIRRHLRYSNIPVPKHLFDTPCCMLHLSVPKYLHHSPWNARLSKRIIEFWEFLNRWNQIGRKVKTIPATMANKTTKNMAKTLNFISVYCWNVIPSVKRLRVRCSSLYRSLFIHSWNASTVPHVFK